MHLPIYVTQQGYPDPSHLWDPGRATALLPGAFNPVHDGHWALAEVAAEILGLPVAFELSVANVDKPALPPEDARARLAQFVGRAPVWLTHCPRFADKAGLFPGATFVVGADTALRIVAPRYYDDERAMLRALAALREHECRFLVACRADAGGQCLEPDDVPVPAAFRDLFAGIPPGRFRLDISSTALRARARGGSSP